MWAVTMAAASARAARRLREVGDWLDPAILVWDSAAGDAFVRRLVGERTVAVRLAEELDRVEAELRLAGSVR